MRNLIVGIVTGIFIGVIMAGTWFVFKDKYSDKVYTVRSVTSHYPHKNDNSETTLVVYEKGDSGHVKEILCLFPPDFQLNGIKKVRVKRGIAKRYIGGVGYYCEEVE